VAWRSRRRAQVEPVDLISAGASSTARLMPKPCSANAAAAPATRSSADVGTPSRPSRSRGARRSSSVPSGATRLARPRATRSSRPTTPRSSEPHGKRTVTRLATPRSSAGGASAPATTKPAFGRPPLRAGCAARREDSVIDAAFASRPRTSVAGSRVAAASTARPSPVPASIVTRSWRATRSATYPTSTSRRRRPTTKRSMRGRIPKLPAMAETTTKPIGPYERLSAEVHEWDPRTVEVAVRVAELVRERRPDLEVEHIGSTAVPGLPGKGIVDLSIETTPEDIPGVVAMLYELGFGPQPGPDPLPPTRPMPVGSLELGGRHFRIHLHVQPTGSDFPRDIAFRDALRNDPELRSQYEGLKRGITS